MKTARCLHRLALAAALSLPGAAVRANDHPWWWWFGADGKADEIMLFGDWTFGSGTWRANRLTLGHDVGDNGGNTYPYAATLVQTGGSLTVGQLYVAFSMSDGTYTVRGGTLVATDVVVGSGGYGAFNHEQGSVSFASLTIGSSACCRGVSGDLVHLSGGVRTITSTNVGTYSHLVHDGGTTFGTRMVVDLGTLEMNGGLLVMSQGIELKSEEIQYPHGIVQPFMTFSGGSIQGGPLVNEGHLTWTGGTLVARLENKPGADVTADGPGLYATELANAGLVTLTGRARLELGPGTSKNADTGSIAFAPGARLTVRETLVNAGSLSGAPAFAGPGTLLNEGLLQPDAGGELRLDLARVVNTSGGVIALDTSRVRGSAAVINEADALLRSRGATRFDPALRNQGRFELGSGTFTAAGGIVNQGEIVLGDAVARLEGGALRNERNISGLGTLDLALTNAGRVRAEGGTLDLRRAPALEPGSQLQAGPGATLHLAGGLALHAQRMLLDGGTIDIAGIVRNTGRIEGQGTLVTGELLHQGQMRWQGTSDIHGRTRVEGRVDADAGALLTWHDAVTLAAGALLAPAAGARMLFAAPVTWQQGALGIGAGELDFGAQLALDGAGLPATLNHAGSLRLLDGARLRVELGAGGAHDGIDAGGGLALGGTLQLAFAPGFSAAAGDRYALLHWGGALTGRFGAFDTGGVQPGPDLRWDWSRLYVDGTLGVSAVPEPGSRTLMALGAALLLGRRIGAARMARPRQRGIAPARELTF